MLNLLYEPFPESVTADGREWPVLTDFRDWLRFYDLQRDKDVPDAYKLLMLAEWITVPVPRITAELVAALNGFFRANGLEPERSPAASQEETPRRPPLFDFKFDSRWLLADFRQYYRIDLLRVPYLHWWEFRSLFAALPDDSRCAKRIGYRAVNTAEIRDKTERQRIARIQREIALPSGYAEYDDEMIGAALWEIR